MQFSATVTALRSAKKLTMLAKSRLAGHTTTSSHLTLRGSVGKAGAYAVHLVLGRKALVHGHTYVIHLSAVNAKGKKTASRSASRPEHAAARRRLVPPGRS